MLNKFFNRGSDRSQTVKKNIIGSVAIKGWSILIQLILVPLTMDYLSPEIYGIWLTVSSIMLWLNFFDVGFTLGLKNKLNEALAAGEYHKGKILVSTTYVMMILIFIPIGLILQFIIPLIDWSAFLNVNQKYNGQLVNVMRILSICVCLQMVFNTLTAVLAAFQRTALSNVFPVIGNTISVFIILILRKTVPASLTSLAEAISFLPIIVLFVSSIILYRGRLKSVAPSLTLFDRKYVFHIFSLGVRFFIIQIQFVILYQATNILISNVSSPEQVTSYNIAYKYLTVGSMLFSIVLGPLWPAYTDAYFKKDFAWMRGIYKKMTKVFFVLIGVVVLMVVASPIAYKMWIGSYDLVPVGMTLIVGIYVIIHTWDSLQVTLINGIGAIKLQTYVTVIGIVLHIPLSLFLGKTLGWGGIGVVSSMCFINLLYSVFFTIQIRKLLTNTANSIWRE